MLSQSDIEIGMVLPIFAEPGIDVAFLVPTETGYEKSIMDATQMVRDLLSDTGVHNYWKQGQGPENKVQIKSYFVNIDSLTETHASLYRPQTKKGDPRIWFGNLRQYCKPNNLLALIVIRKEIYVFNLSNEQVLDSLLHRQFADDIIQEAVIEKFSVSRELLGKIQAIHDLGFLRSITRGDPGVGDTLENALGISRNNSKLPDYKGIELKASRLTRNGKPKSTTRVNLFTKVPDVGLSYRDILETYGKVQIPKGMTEPRLQIYETCRASRPNAYDLMLDAKSSDDKLDLVYSVNNANKFVSGWMYEGLKETLKIKHRETFWVKAVSETRDGVEYFRYDKIEHTKQPNTSVLIPLFSTDRITVDLAAHIDLKTNKYKDHGVLFKIEPYDLHLLFGEPEIFDLNK